MRRQLFLALLLLLIAPGACPQGTVKGQGSVKGSGQVVTPPTVLQVTVTVVPNAATLAVSTTQAFTATVRNDSFNRGVTWSLSGPGCSGATCGTISPTASLSGVPVTYTAPASVPSPNSVILTATSVLQPTVASSANVMLNVVNPPPPVTIGTICKPTTQTPSSLNIFSCAASNQSTIVVGVAVSTGNVISGVQACLPSNSCSMLSPACPPSGNCFSAGGGRAQIFYGIGLPLGITAINVFNSTPSGGILDITAISVQNVNAFDTAAQLSNQTIAGNNPIGASVTAKNANELILSVIFANSRILAVASPFTLTASTPPAPVNSADAVAYAIGTSPGAYSPSWTAERTSPATVTFGAISAAFVNGITSPTVSVAVSPVTASVATNATQKFTPTVSNGSQGVTWTLSGAGCSGATCGTLSSSSTASGIPVTYTAPNAVPAPATVTLTATSIDDVTKTAAATITVTASNVIGVTVSPTSASVVANATSQSTATVTNDSAGVNWTITGAGCSGATCGTVSPTSSASGVAVTYTAPSAVPSPATVSLTATSITDGTKSATETITITAAVITVSVSPTTATLTGGGMQQAFTPTVVNSNSGVNWSLSCSATFCGSLSATSSNSGVPITYTSPTVASPLTVTLTAKSIADNTKTAAATINVNPSPITFHCTDPNCPAFPGAQGAGASSLGGSGRAGSGTSNVYFVDNTNDSGPGSLRSCVEGTGPRTCIFRIAGITHPTGRYNDTNPYLTVAGQTAPGSGFVVSGDQLGVGEVPLWSESHDSVWRYLTVRIGGTNTAGPASGNACMAVSCNGTLNNIYDHISCSWFGNNALTVYSNINPPTIVKNLTLQWSLIYQPNINFTGMSLLDAANDADSVTDLDLHHNVCLTCGRRLPLYNTKGGRWVSNLSWNWDSYVALYQGGVAVDSINNKYKAGSFTTGTNHEFNVNPNASPDVNGSLSGTPSHYFVGNIGPNNATATTTPNDAGQLAMTCTGDETGDGSPCPISNSFLRSTPLGTQPFPITQDLASTLDTVLLPTAGNSQMLTCDGTFVNRRDSIDAAEVALYQANGVDSYFNGYTASKPQFPTVTPGTVCTWTNNLPDAWVAKYNINNTPTLWQTIDPVTGVTFLEDYLDGLVP